MVMFVARETRKGWDSHKLSGLDRFLMERDMLNERPWYGRRHIMRYCNTYRWAEKFRWERLTQCHFEEP